MIIRIEETRLRRIMKGQYQSENGKWRVERKGRNWFAYREGELWGHWETDSLGKFYVPFKALWEAVVVIEEYEARGLA